MASRRRTDERQQPGDDMTTIDTERLAKLETLPLLHGGHANFEAGACAMEAVAWLAGEPHSDRPQCACPVISKAMIRLNDRIGDDEMRTELLRPLLPKIIGTRAAREVMIKRGFIAADFAERVFYPLYLEARGRTGEAARWRSAEEITDKSSALRARDNLR